MIRSIVFFGYKHKCLTKKIENSVYNFLNPFVKRFESIVDSFKKFSELLVRGGNCTFDRLLLRNCENDRRVRNQDE